MPGLLLLLSHARELGMVCGFGGLFSHVLRLDVMEDHCPSQGCRCSGFLTLNEKRTLLIAESGCSGRW